MTRKSESRLRRDKSKIPPKKNIATFRIDDENQANIITTKNILINQIQRDGPKICKSFDALMISDIDDCSEVIGFVTGMLLQHLPKAENNNLKPTTARLLMSAINTYTASIEVARHGYPRQFGVLARTLIETLATVIALVVDENALEKFHEGKLKSTKCIHSAKKVLPPIGEYWGMLSKDFVHINRGHALLEGAIKYKSGDEELIFITTVLRANVWMLYVVSELVFSEEIDSPRYWERIGQHAIYNPSNDELEWMSEFLGK